MMEGAPPIQINDETLGLIQATWTRDCKELACFHKFFLQLLDIIGDYGNEEEHGYSIYRVTFRSKDPYPLPNYIHISDVEGVQSLQRELFFDLESLIPEYFNDLPPSRSDQEKFELLRHKLENAWMSYPKLKRYNGSDSSESFRRTLSRTLSKEPSWRFTEAGPPRDIAGGTSTLLQESLKQVLNQLSESVEGEQATFCCGGSIAIDPSNSNSSNSPPVTIYWTGDNEQPFKVSLPPGNTSPLDQLLADCAPAGFDLESKGGPGTSYQHVGALYRDLPIPSRNASLSFEESEQNFVHSSNTGEYKKCVDTSGSKALLGFLVVCLPSPHEGGRMTVHHQRERVIFDWSHLSSSKIQWAAFYDDSESEIDRVSKGHLVTLTYKLFVSEPIGGPLIQNPIVDVKSFPLHGLFKAALGNPGFLKDGGVLGIFCSQPYPHTSQAAASSLPQALKGTDMALFSILQSLGLRVRVLPVLATDGSYSTGNSKLNSSIVEPSDKRSRQRDSHGCWEDYQAKQDFDHFQKTGKMNPKHSLFRSHGDDEMGSAFYLRYRKLFYDVEGPTDLQLYWKILQLGIIPYGLGPPSGSRVGDDLHPYFIIDDFCNQGEVSDPNILEHRCIY
ncbi:hypothetical protein FQN54_005021 [Arachnomyces sp. PD_36]|nr:hypothetical protein FQN54_005021 [Arachnomyces sp. PD_36]